MHKLKNPRKYVERLKTRIADRWRHKAPWNEGCGMTEHHIPLCAEIDRPTMRRGKCPRFPDAQVCQGLLREMQEVQKEMSAIGGHDGKRMD
jgi:hypothetical protein